MKFRMHPAVVLVVAALATPAAWAVDRQANPQGNVAPPGTTLTDSNTPTTEPDETAAAASLTGHNPHAVPQMTYVAEPTASASKTEGSDGELGKSIVDEINADPSLKGSKITVQPDDGKITLSGVTETMDQKKKAVAIAQAKVGVENVIDAIRNADV